MLLHDWYQAADSYYFTDLPFYLAAVAGYGPTPVVYRIVPPLIYALVILLACRLAVPEGVGGLRRVWPSVAALLALVGLPGTFMAGFALRASEHIGTLLFALGMLCCLRRFQTRLVAPAALAVLVTLAAFSDAFVLVIGVIPILLDSALRLWRSWSQSEARKTEWAVLRVTLGATVLGFLLLHLVQRFGGFSSQTAPLARPTWALLRWKGQLLVEGWPRLFGATPHSLLGGLLSTIGTVLTAAGMLWGVSQVLTFFRRSSPLPDRLVSVASLAILGTFGGYFLVVRALDLNVMRYVFPAAVLSAILAGRLCLAVRDRLREPRRLHGAMALLLVSSLLGFIGSLAQPPAGNDRAGLERWLIAQGYARGYGGYWVCNSVTVDTGGRLHLLPVAGINGGLAAEYFEVRGHDFDTPGHFLIFNPNDGDGLSALVAARVFGPPQEVKAFGPYIVATWPRR